MTQAHQAGESNSFALFLAQIAIGAFAVSVAYDIGFYREIGFGLSELPTTFADHTKTCISWLPYLAFIALSHLFHSVFIKRLEGGLTENQIINTSKNPKTTKFFRTLPYHIAIILFTLAVILSIFSYDKFRHFLPAAFAILWIEVLFWCLKHPGMKDKFKKSSALFIIFFPALCLFIWQTGKNDALNQLTSSSNTYIFKIHDGTTITGKLVRSLEKGYIVKPDTQHSALMFISNAFVVTSSPKILPIDH